MPEAAVEHPAAPQKRGNNNIKVRMSGLRVEEPSQNSVLMKIFKGVDYMFHLKTIGRNKNRAIGVRWEAKRKYSDFEWLRESLVKFYPGVVIPPLPSHAKSLDKIAGHKIKLENFLMDAYRCP